MEATHKTIDWNSSDILMQIAQHLQHPLASIIEANKRAAEVKNDEKQENVSEIIFSNSQEISRLIKEVTDIARSRSIQISKKQQPIIFDIYNPIKKRRVRITHFFLSVLPFIQYWWFGAFFGEFNL